MDTDYLVGIALALYVAAALLPGAFDNFFGVNTTGWDPGVAALFLLLPLFFIIAIIRRANRSGGAA